MHCDNDAANNNTTGDKLGALLVIKKQANNFCASVSRRPPFDMDTDMEADLKKPATSLANDEIDFHSGYETQYQKEYSPLKPVFVPPPDQRHAWFRNLGSIAMIIFLTGVFLLGTILLVVAVFTVSPIQVLIIVVIYVLAAAIMIWLEVQSIKMR